MQLEDGTIIDRVTLISLAAHAPKAVIRMLPLGGGKWYEHAACAAEKENDWVWTQPKTVDTMYVRGTQNDKCATCRKPL